MHKSFYILFSFLILISCTQNERIETFKGSTMGTYYSVKVVTKSSMDKRELAREIDLDLAHINDVFSTYIPTSELSKINKHLVSSGFDLSPEMQNLLRLSKKISSDTEGYFDVTVGPIVNAWGFGPDGKRKRPTENELDELKEKVGMEKFDLVGEQLIKKDPRIYIDLSAIAKGYGVDHVLEMLKAKGFTAALVEIGGEVRAFGTKPKGEDWLIGIEKPSEKLGAGIQAVVSIKDMAMATSGSYRNYVKYGDEVFSHTIDPKTGRPAHNNVISVTVLAKTCAEADGYATSLLAIGHEKGLSLAKKLGLAAYFIVKKGAETAIISTDSFKPYLREI